AHDRLRRAAARSQERAPPPASGNHDYPQAGVADARREPRVAGGAEPDRSRRGAGALAASGRNGTATRSEGLNQCRASALRSIPFALITGRAAGAVRNSISSLAVLTSLALTFTPATMTM